MVKAKSKKPWEVAGLSRSTYYRTKAKPAGEAPKKRGRPAKKPPAKSIPRRLKVGPLVRGWRAVGKAEPIGVIQPLEQSAAPRPGIDLHPADRVMVDEFLAVFGPIGLKRFDRRSITGGMVAALITTLKFHGYGPDPDGN